MNRAYVIRHGVIQWSLDNRIIGQSDPPLISQGVNQAREVAAQLKDSHFDVVFTSPLSRARSTAVIIAEQRHLEIISRDELLEASFGSLEGRLMGDVDVLPFWRARKVDKYRFMPPGGEDYRTVEARVARLLESIDRMLTPLIVTHVGVIRVMARRYGGLSEKAAGDLCPDHRDIWRLDFGPDPDFRNRPAHGP